MKKKSCFKVLALSLIMFLGFSIHLFSQGINLPFQSDFSAIPGESVESGSTMPILNADNFPDGFLFAGSSRIYGGGQKLKFGVAQEIGILPTDVINTSGTGNIEVIFKAIAWPTSAGKTADILLTYGDQTAEFTLPPGTWPVTNDDFIEFSCQFTAISTPTSLFFKTTTNSSTNECRMFLGDVRIIDEGSANQVANPTFSPGSGTYTEPVNVTISSATTGATIRYTLDGSDPTESSTQYSTPIPISETTTLKAKAWKADMDPSNISSATYIFSQGITTLAELRALAPAYNGGTNTGTTVFKYTGQAVVTHIGVQAGSNNNRVKYIQDETAAIYIFDPQGIIIAASEAGDLITNLSGTLTNYFGMIELIPTEDCGILDWNRKVTATSITADQLDFNHDNPIQAKVVTIDEVMFAQPGNYAPNNYYDLKQNNVVFDSVVYTENKEADYYGDQLPTYAVKLKGVINFKGGKDITTKNRLVPLLKSNDVILGISTVNPSVVKLSPNPANNYVNIVAGVPMKLEIYSLLGNLIAVENLYEGTNTISVSEYPAGLYLMKLIDTNTGEAFVQKLVVQ